MVKISNIKKYQIVFVFALKSIKKFLDIDETPEQKKNKQIERQKRRAINSSIMKELENEYSGAPEEIKVEIKKIISFRKLKFIFF
jgi:hypothetical protein